MQKACTSSIISLPTPSGSASLLSDFMTSTMALKVAITLFISKDLSCNLKQKNNLQLKKQKKKTMHDTYESKTLNVLPSSQLFIETQILCPNLIQRKKK
jgi:hypothetical protein